MAKTSDAFEFMSWNKALGCITIGFRNGDFWNYPAKVQEYAMMHRKNVSAGRYLNRVLKHRKGAEKVQFGTMPGDLMLVLTQSVRLERSKRGMAFV